MSEVQHDGATPAPTTSRNRGRARGRGRGRGRNSNRGQGRGQGGAVAAASAVDPLLGFADRAAQHGAATATTEPTLAGEHAGTRRRTRRGGRAGRGGEARGAARKGAGVKQPATDDAGDADDAPLCVVCAERLVFFAVGECNHPGR